MGGVQPTYVPPTASRPVGVAILAVLIGIFGFILFIAGLLVTVGITVSALAGIAVPGHLGGSLFTAGLIVLIIGLIILGTAVGLWHLRVWALVLALLVLVIQLVSYGLAGAFVNLGFAITLVLFIYLLAVSRHFS
jgi:hypothetical protein